jgi:putative ABC transport system permease protein
VTGAVLGTIPGYGLSFLLRDAFAAVGAMPSDFEFVLDPLPGLAAIAFGGGGGAVGRISGGAAGGADQSGRRAG